MQTMRPWREGVATKRSSGGLWWLGGYLALSALMSGYDTHSRMVLGGLWLTSFGVGATWQLVDRRDPADRLVFLAAFTLFFSVMVALPLGGGADLIRRDSGHVVLLLPFIGGVVLAEQWLRRRDRLA